MNTNRTTYRARSVQGAGMLVLATGLLLGTPVMASASPSPCVKAGPAACVAPSPLPNSASPQKPVITDPSAGTLSTRTDGGLLTIVGADWRPNLTVVVALTDSDGHDLLASAPTHQATTDANGAFQLDTNCATGPRFTANGTVSARYQNVPQSPSASLPVIAFPDPAKHVCDGQ